MNQPSTGQFKDHFSAHAADYARYRPGYPTELYDWLSGQCEEHVCAWDVATGNGQAAIELARYFRKVIATDGSAEQISQTRPGPNIDYRVETAEANTLEDQSVDLITVAQAYHWFDHEAFVQQVRRVAKSDGLLAVWTYTLAEINPGLDQVVREFYAGPIDRFWPPERRLVESAYQSLQFPWLELRVPQFLLQLDWSLEELLGYLRTWSAVQRFRVDTGTDPVEDWRPVFSAAWGNQQTRVITWPLKVRCFRVRA